MASLKVTNTPAPLTFGPQPVQQVTPQGTASPMPVAPASGSVNPQAVGSPQNVIANIPYQYIPGVNMDGTPDLSDQYKSIDYFVSDGSQLGDDGKAYQPGQVVFKAPDYFVNSDFFAKSIKPILEQPVQFAADGTPSHPILTQAFKDAIDKDAPIVQAQYNLVQAAKDNYGYDDGAAKVYADTLSNDKFKVDGKDMSGYDFINAFNKADDNTKNNALKTLTKSAESGTDDTIKGQSRAMLDYLTSKAKTGDVNINANFLTLAGRFAQTANKNFLGFGGESALTEGDKDNYLGGLQTAADVGSAVGTGEGIAAGIGTSLVGGEVLSAKALIPLITKLGTAALPAVAEAGSATALGTTLAAVNNAKTIGQILGDTTAFTSPTVVQALTGQKSWADVSDDAIVNASLDGAGRALIGGIASGFKKYRANEAAKFVAALGEDPTAPVSEFGAMSDELVKQYSHPMENIQVTAGIGKGSGAKAPRFQDIAFNAPDTPATRPVVDRALKNAGYTNDEIGTIVSHADIVDDGGKTIRFTPSEVIDSARGHDTVAAQGSEGSKPSKIVMDTSQLGQNTNRIVDGITGLSNYSKQKAAGVLSNVFKIDNPTSLSATRLIESGKGEEAQKLLESKGINIDYRQVMDGLRDVANKLGLKVDDRLDYVARNLYKDRDAKRTVLDNATYQGSSRAYGKKEASFEKQRVNGTLEETVADGGSVKDVNMMNNLMAYTNELLTVARNHKIEQALAADGSIVYAPVRNTNNDIRQITKKGTTRFESSGGFLSDQGYARITDENVLNALNAKANNYGVRTGVWAKPETKRMLDTLFKPEDNDPITRGLRAFAEGTRIIQNFNTAGGIPFTAANNLSFFQAVENATANPKDTLKFIKNFIGVHSTDAYRRFLINNDEIVQAMAKEGINPVEFDTFGRAVKGARAEAAAGNEAIEDTIKLVTNKNTPKDIIDNFDEKYSGATFRFLNSMQIDTFARDYRNLLAKGVEEPEARRIAAQRYKNFYGLRTGTEHINGWLSRLLGPDRARDFVTAMISAPRYKAMNIQRIVNTVKGFNPKVLLNPSRRTEYVRNYIWAANTLTTLVGIEAANYAINGKSTWDSLMNFDDISRNWDTLNVPVNKLPKEFQGLFREGDVLQYSRTNQQTAWFRSLGRAVNAMVSGDKDTGQRVLDEVLSQSSYGAQPLLRLIINQQYGGKQIHSSSDNAVQQAVEAFGFLASKYVSHPYIRAIDQYNKGNAYAAITTALENPISLTNARTMASIDFNTSVAPDVQTIVDEHIKAMQNAFKDPKKQDSIEKDLFNDIKDRIDISAKRYGYSDQTLTTQMAGKLLSIIVGKQVLQLGGYDTYDGSEQADTQRNLQMEARQGAAQAGLNIYRPGDYTKDLQNQVFGAPKRIAYDFTQALKGDPANKVPSLYDVKQGYDKQISDLYDQAKGLKGSAATAIYDQISKVQEDYMNKFDTYVKPLVDQYGVDVIANNSKVFDALRSYVMVPNDLTPFASSTKQPYLTDDVKQYLKDRYGVGPLDSRNLPTDPQVIEGIKRVNTDISNGKRQSAIFKLNSMQQDINAGKMYADPAAMSKISGMIKANNKRK